MLFAPLKYWRVRHPLKFQWDYVIPGLSSLVVTTVLQVWPGIASPFSQAGFLAGLQNLHAILGGFFVAALTLLATAQAPALAKRLAGWPPTTYGKETAPLTRQRFLCMLFGYLAFSAFGLYCVGFAAMLLAPGGKAMVSEMTRSVASIIFMLAYVFWLAHMIVTTLVGLYYFTDRLQRPDPERIKMPVPAE